MNAIKSILPIFITLALAAGVYAGDRSKSKIQGVTALACVNVSSTTWTAVPSTTTIKSGRGGIMVFAPRSTVGAFNLVFTSYTVATPGIVITSATFDMVAGDSKDLDISEYIYLHAVSTHTAAVSSPLCYQEYTFDKDR